MLLLKEMKRAFALLTILACLKCSRADSVEMKIVWLNKSSNDPLAICNGEYVDHC